ncbi:MAG: hypothetical protein WCV93_04535 [Candidatus Shapirobacteria bacterium]
MHIIYLSGGSLRNKTWIETIKSNFDTFSDGQILYYDHWQTGEKNLNFEIESQKLAELVKDKDEYFVFAKSIGSILALKSIYEKTINPKRMIICGHPYNLTKELGFPVNDYLKYLAVPTMFIQNEFDLLFNYVDLEKVLKENSPVDYQLIKNPDNNTHDYEDFEQLAELSKIYFGDEDKQVHLGKIYTTLDIVAKKLNSLDIKWFLGASGALMVHGVNIVPWDIDVLTTSENIDIIAKEFEKFLVSTDDDGLFLKINGIEVEIIKLNDLGDPTPTLFQNNLIPVNTLKNELYYYEQRPGKENTIRLIKEKLGI